LEATDHKDVVKWWGSPKNEVDSQRPFELPQNSKTLDKYSQIWEQFICYVIRTTPEEFDEETETGVQYTSEQWECVVRSTLRTLLEMGKLLAQTLPPHLPRTISTALTMLTVVDITKKTRILSWLILKLQKLTRSLPKKRTRSDLLSTMQGRIRGHTKALGSRVGSTNIITRLRLSLAVNTGTRKAS
jgi:hypothetical protein